MRKQHIAANYASERPGPRSARRSRTPTASESRYSTGLEFLDSKGEILEHAQRYQEAAEALETVLQGEPDRLGTRQRLMRCYEQLGLTEKANAQRNMIETLRASRLKSKNPN